VGRDGIRAYKDLGGRKSMKLDLSCVDIDNRARYNEAPVLGTSVGDVA
jgi:hypothetical protein